MRNQVLGTNPRGSPRIRLISSFAMLAPVIGGVSTYSVRKTSELFDIGVNDHVRCAIANADRRETGLGTEFAPMLQPVLDAAGADYAAVSAHRCNIDDRAYIHIILRRGQTLVSLILTRHGDQEVFPRSLAGPLHEGKRDGYSVAAFESGAYLVYIISTLPGHQNGELAARVAPVIERYTK